MFLIKNADVYTITDGVKKEYDLLIEKGKIVKIDKNIKNNNNYEEIDAKGKRVYPGFIDAHAHIGIMEGGVGGSAGDDTNEAIHPVTSNVRAIDGINPFDVCFEEAISEGGVTSAMVAPGSANIIGGEVCAIKMSGKTVDEMVIDPCIGMKMALGENPKRVYGNQGKTPMTRMANAAVMREVFFKAKEYMEKKKDKDKAPAFDLKMENLIKVLKKKIPARIHAHRADDIATAIRIMKEFKLKYVIEHTTEGHKIPEVVAAAGVPVCVGPTLTGKSKYELRDKTIKTVKALHDAGVEVAISTDHPVIDLYFLPICAGYALKTGVSEEEVLKMITINPAKICNIDKKVGSLEKGKDADVVIWDGNPLYPDANVHIAFINGKIVYKRD